MRIRTKIVCTMGPAVRSNEKLDALIDAGMNVARLNFSHGTYTEHAHTIELLKAARERRQVPLAIMLDTKGPEIRIGKIEGEQVSFKSGDQFWLVKEKLEGNHNQISLTPSYVIDYFKEGMVVLIDNGYFITHVVEVNDRGAKVQVDHGGILSSNKGVNVPGSDFNLPVLTEKDIEDIKFGCKNDIDLIAASFVRSAEHVVSIKKLLEDCGKPDISVIAKIENRSGVENIDSIVQMADGIMIARGDLGVELSLTHVPRLQKMMIRKCYLAGKPSVTATQMLESMIKNPRPTRAETSDVANAIYDSTSAAMLSGETAVGDYPIEAVEMMRAIIEETERDFKYYEFSKFGHQRIFPDVPSSVALASIRMAYSANVKAIFAFTSSGLTARLIARFRPEMPVIAMTPSTKVYHQLALCWGVIPILCKKSHNVEDSYNRITAFALEKGYVKYGDLVVIVAGTPFGRPGTANMIIVDSIGDVLVRGKKGYGSRIAGRIAHVSSPEMVKEYEIKGKIIVINNCNEEYLHLLQNALGVILENHSDDVESELFLHMAAAKTNMPILFRAEGAAHILREEQLVTLDPEQAIVYKGVI